MHGRHTPKAISLLNGTRTYIRAFTPCPKEHEMDVKRILAVVGVLAIIGVSLYLVNDYRKGDMEKFGDDVADSVKDATN